MFLTILVLSFYFVVSYILSEFQIVSSWLEHEVEVVYEKISVGVWYQKQWQIDFTMKHYWEVTLDWSSSVTRMSFSSALFCC